VVIQVVVFRVVMWNDANISEDLAGSTFGYSIVL
jgi:hypothetical protein